MLSLSLFQIIVSFDLIYSLSYIFLVYVCVCSCTIMFIFLFFFVFFLRVHKGQCVKNCNT